MYRIVTESKNIELLKIGLGELGLDYTFYYCYGSWKGQPENSLTIELDNVTKAAVEEAAKLIKQINDQEKVLIQEIPVISQFV